MWGRGPLVQGWGLGVLEAVGSEIENAEGKFLNIEVVPSPALLSTAFAFGRVFLSGRCLELRPIR